MKIAAALIALLALTGCTAQSVPGDHDLSKEDAIAQCVGVVSAQKEVLSDMTEYDALRAAQTYCAEDGNWESYR